MASYKTQLEMVRQFTGDSFSAKNGYDLRKPPSFGKRMAVLRYFRKIQELTSSAVQVYTPTKKTKREAFNYTGQSGWKKFTKAIVRKTTPDQEFDFVLDKSKPRGHRFVAVDHKTGRRYYNLPAHLFDGDDIDADMYAEVIAQYAEDAVFFLIGAGETFMWGAGGGRENIAEKIATVFRNYSAAQFDVNDKNSSYYGNWFRGVTGFTSRFDAFPQIREATRKQQDYRSRMGLPADGKKYRRLLGYGPNGRRMLGVFQDGELLDLKEMTWEASEVPGTVGYKARQQGRPITDNPFQPGTKEYKQWREGYLLAKRQGYP